ncbi:ABC transporter substrate-binding protein [Cohnella caldifontis]|uniref:ABC transporter substrate-binding protein n=1 Tax=Cohnella caldifontis TaxID=3027471 RepID=UPI0023EC8CDD|nr:ABC transporter substrate-binding protein [Cohnella sp. YIM B05605]
MWKKRKWRRRTILGGLLALTMAFAAACGAEKAGTAAGEAPVDATNQTSPADAASAQPASAEPKAEPVKVVWWHSMSGELGKAIDHLVEEFNESHPDIQVEAAFQGSYDESLSKMKTAMGSGSGPSIVQVYEIGSRFMIDSKTITPIQKFIDEDRFDLSRLEENILGYYTFDGQLYSMPFNTSNPIMYYNKTLFKNAGLDPEKPPATFEEVKAAAQKLTKDGVYGASFALYGWFMEQLFAAQGKEYVDHGNGRDGLAEKSLLADDAGVKVMTWWKDLIDSKVMLNLGRATADTKKAFVAGQVAMTLDSTAALRGIVDGVGGKFEVGTAFLPRPEGAADGGVIVGGASLYILNDRPEAEQKAAWAFIKFLASPEQQAYWNVNSGYFPITKAAYEQDLVKENMKKFPQFQTAVDQLHRTKLNNATKGAVMGVFPEARQIVEGAMEEVVNGAKSPKDALTAAQVQITAKIGDYNKTVK